MNTTEDPRGDASGTASAERDDMKSDVVTIPAGTTTFASANDLADALRRAAAAHGEHEKRIGEADPDWPDWYAAYMVAAEAGAELPT